MESSALFGKVLSYIESRSDTESLRFLDYSRPEIVPGVACSGFFLKIDGKDFYSYGTAQTLDESIKIAVMEIAERILSYGNTPNLYRRRGLLRQTKNLGQIAAIYPRSKNWNPPNSSGIAIHTSRRIARESAISELVERHVVLKAIAMDISPKRIIELPKFLEQINQPGARINYFAFRGPYERYVVISRMSSSRGTAYGFGCAKNLLSAIKKAAFELVPKILLWRGVWSCALATETLDLNFSHHWGGKSQETDKFFAESPKNIPKIDCRQALADLWIGSFNLPIELGSSGLYLSRAICPYFQPLFHGHWSPEIVNPMAIPCEKLPCEPHFVA